MTLGDDQRVHTPVDAAQLAAVTPDAAQGTGQITTVLVALATTDGMPSQMSAGKEMRLPPPATVLMASATTAAAPMTRLSKYPQDTQNS